MSVAPHAGIVDFGTFTSPTSSVDGIQGEVPQPLAGQQNYVLTANGWVALSSLGTLVFQGTWNASTNSPTLTSSVGVQGYYYVVSVAGNTNLNGITTWTVGDWAIFSGSVWQKLEGGSTVDITGGTINGTTIGATTPSTATIAGLTVQDTTDGTKKGTFDLSSLPTATTFAYTLPNVTGTLAALNLAQTFTQTQSFSGGLSMSGVASNYNMGTSTTTGVVTIGGTSSTSILTVGRSTVSQQIDIQAGATASGSTKAINIGTAGLSGSTTTIAIGSAVSGATSRTTLNGLVVNSITAAVSAAGTTQGTATGLVSNINNVTVVATGATGVRLPTAVAGMRILVRNSDSADTLSIYPATGGTIDALAANAAFTLAAGSTIELMATTTTQWYTF